MAANLCLITCALLTAQPADSEWLLVPRLSRGQELVYRGTYAEETMGRGVQFSRSYRLESRIFVLDTSARNIDIALFTSFRPGTPRPQKEIEIEPTSARLELARLTLQGRLSADGELALAVPLDGPPTVECGAFVEFPRGRIGAGQTWQVSDENRPPRSWKIIGTEMANNTSCLRLECVQQSPDWEQPRGDGTAWQRRDTIWLQQNLGVACKVERTIERRDQQVPRQRLVVQYELQTNVQLPRHLFEDRRREIMQARSFNAALAPMLPNPTRYPAVTFDAMLAKINHHLDSEPRTPYREAVLQVKRRVESAKRGETPPSAIDDKPASSAAIGQRAPDFISTNLLTRESIRLRRFLGRPVLMVFYTPVSTKAEEVLRFAQGIKDTLSNVHVVAFAVSDDTARIGRQYRDFQLSLPILSGKGLRQSYGVESTPKFLILDADGVVRGSYDGWGLETPAAVAGEVRLWLMKKAGSTLQKGSGLSPDR